jgi:hypothetical protein
LTFPVNNVFHQFPRRLSTKINDFFVEALRVKKVVSMTFLKDSTVSMRKSLVFHDLGSTASMEKVMD